MALRVDISQIPNLCQRLLWQFRVAEKWHGFIASDKTAVRLVDGGVYGIKAILVGG
jgi:hypothetical protein